MPPNILLVRFSAMGDTLLVTPLLRALRTRHPDAAITLVTKAAYAPLFRHNPRVTEVIGWEPGSSLRALARRLRAQPFTHRLDLHGSLRSRALRWQVGGRWTGYPKHRAARAVLIRTRRNVYRDLRPVAERYFDAALGLDVTPDAGSLEIFLPRAAQEAADRFLAARELGLRRQLIAVAPGASRFTKRWPTHHWIALARRLVEAGNDVVVLGGTAELEAAREIVEGGGLGVGSAAGEFDLPGTAALLKRARALVAGDTGAMHLATAVGTPVAALFGPTVQAFGFFPYHAKAIVLQRELSCRPCSAQGSDRCPLKHHRCLQDLQPEEVLESLRKLPPMSLLSGAAVALVKFMGEVPRGPRREGVFALWLTLRVAEDVLLAAPAPDRAMRRRVAALEQRLSSLALPGPFRRALAGALSELREPRRERAALALQQLIAPAREALGPEAGDAVGRAARSALQRLKEP